MSNEEQTIPRPFSEELRDFIAREKWTFAKTYAKTWPHEYIVRERVDEDLFVQLVRHIREHGYEGRFYSQKNMYFDCDGMAYWTMGEPISETTIINRCPEEGTYESRLKSGTLPEQQATKMNGSPDQHSPVQSTCQLA